MISATVPEREDLTVLYTRGAPGLKRCDKVYEMQKKWVSMRKDVGFATLLATVCILFYGGLARAQPDSVLRATLSNGLRVIIVRNTLAPVVAVSVNYLSGSVETPPGFPGTAHAMEHMMFRGSPGLTAEQLANIGNVMGGNFNANTRENLTQYL